MKNKTIHARIGDQTFEELEYLKKDLGMPETTQVISFALHHLFSERQNRHAEKPLFERLEELDLIGSLSAPEELSESYKEVLTKSLTKKHSLRKASNAK